MTTPTKSQIDDWCAEAPDDEPHYHIARQAYLKGFYDGLERFDKAMRKEFSRK